MHCERPYVRRPGDGTHAIMVTLSEETSNVLGEGDLKRGKKFPRRF
jgi:hypothetical protein